MIADISTPGWITYSIAVIGLVAGLGTMWRTVVNPLRKAGNRAEEMYPILLSLTETFRDFPAAFEVLRNMAEQFKTDGGSSLRDVVNELTTMARASAATSASNATLAATLAVGVETARQLADQDRAEQRRLLLQQDRMGQQILAILAAIANMQGGQDVLQGGQAAIQSAAAAVARDLAESHDRADAVRGAPGEAADAGAQSNPPRHP